MFLFFVVLFTLAHRAFSARLLSDLSGKSVSFRTEHTEGVLTIFNHAPASFVMKFAKWELKSNSLLVGLDVRPVVNGSTNEFFPENNFWEVRFLPRHVTVVDLSVAGQKSIGDMLNVQPEGDFGLRFAFQERDEITLESGPAVHGIVW